MNQKQNKEEIQINLGELLYYLLEHVWMIIFVCLLGAVLIFCYNKFFITPQYMSTTSAYILDRESSGSTEISQSDMQVSTQLIKDCLEVVTSRTVLNTVIEQLSLHETYGTLKNKISASASTDTRILKISVTDPNPQQAKEIADAVREVTGEQVKNVMGIEAVNVLDEGNMPTGPCSPNTNRNVLLGVLALFFVSAVICVIRFVMDDTVKTQDDVEKYFGLSMLGAIPSADAPEHTRSGRRKANNRRNL